MTAIRRVLLIGVLAGVAACRGGPTEPGQGPLPTGRWSGDGACLSVTETGCDLVVGCGHGQFPRPSVRGDGTFEASGTYRIEIGPLAIEPAPPAHFSGSFSRSTLTLRVVPSVASIPPASYVLQPGFAGGCSIRCL